MEKKFILGLCLFHENFRPFHLKKSEKKGYDQTTLNWNCEFGLKKNLKTLNLLNGNNAFPRKFSAKSPKKK